LRNRRFGWAICATPGSGQDLLPRLSIQHGEVIEADARWRAFFVGAARIFREDVRKPAG
jgi:hypothetical protein